MLPPCGSATSRLIAVPLGPTAPNARLNSAKCNRPSVSRLDPNRPATWVAAHQLDPPRNNPALKERGLPAKPARRLQGFAALAGRGLCEGRMAIVNSAVYGTRAFSRGAEYLIDGPEHRGALAFGPDHVLFLERCENGVKRPERGGRRVGCRDPRILGGNWRDAQR